MENQSTRGGMMARVQRKADANFQNKQENYVKQVLEGKAEVEVPERTITKFFSRG